MIGPRLANLPHDRRWLAPFLVGLVALGLARIALLPGLAYWDTAELQAVGPLLGTAHPTGFPTYVLVGWLASVVLQPFGDPAFRMNLLAALCVALAAGVTVDLTRLLTRSTALGVLAGIGLAGTPIVWKIGTHAETHALHLALLVILVWTLVAWQRRRSDRMLVAAVVVFGLSVGNHSLTLLLVPAIGAYVLAVQPDILRRWRFVLVCVSVLSLTIALVYLELPLRAGPFRAPLVYGRPETWEGFWYVVSGAQFRGSLVGPFQDLDPKALELIARTVDAFGPLAPLLPLGFAATVRRWPRYALLSGLATATTALFAGSYVNADIGRYYVGPVLFAWTWLAILAAVVVDAVQAALRRADESGGRPEVDELAMPKAALPGSPFPRGALTVVAAAVLLIPSIVAGPGRLAALDRSQDRDARGWVERTLATLAPEAVVVSWWSYSTSLWYVQRVEGRRLDVEIVDDRTRLDQDLGDVTDVIDANLPTRPVYVIRQDADQLARLADRYLLQALDPDGRSGLARVIGRREAGR
ncbi:MAG: DUF2723 domain-containing protein [Chloroflexi bacterium]|nr:DUF2723 domain-containing protein [Chloroflexota bacterium]